jgi:hypothetical protein
MSRRAIELLLEQIKHKQASTGGWEVHTPMLLRESTKALPSRQ